MKSPIPEWINKKYGRYAAQAYACLTRNGRTLSSSWEDYRNKKEALNEGKQLKIDL